MHPALRKVVPHLIAASLPKLKLAPYQFASLILKQKKP